MRQLICLAVLVIVAPALLKTCAVYAQYWSGCSSDLDGIRRAARDASDEADTAESAEWDFEQARDDLQNCVNFPDVYDLLEDGCQSKRWDYESAQSEYESAVSGLEYELSSLARKIRAAENSCDYGLGRRPYMPITETPPAQKNEALTASDLADSIAWIAPSLVEGLPLTLRPDVLGTERLAVLAELVGCSASEIQELLWGKTAVPKGDPLWNATWYYIRFTQSDSPKSILLYANEGGTVIFRSHDAYFGEKGHLFRFQSGHPSERSDAGWFRMG